MTRDEWFDLIDRVVAGTATPHDAKALLAKVPGCYNCGFPTGRPGVACSDECRAEFNAAYPSPPPTRVPVSQ